MILFGVGVHCDEVLNKTKYHGSGHLFAITTWAFGITVCLYVFGGVCMNPAMVLCQTILGLLPPGVAIPYMVADMLGAFAGALVVYVMYADQFKASEDNVDPVAIWRISCSQLRIRQTTTGSTVSWFRERHLLPARFSPLCSFVIS